MRMREMEAEAEMEVDVDVDEDDDKGGAGAGPGGVGEDEDAISPVGEGVPRIPSFKHQSLFPGVHDYPFPPSRGRGPADEGPPL